MLKFRNVNIIFLVLILMLPAINYLVDFPKYIYGLLFLFWLIITTIGSFNILLNYHLTSFNFNADFPKKAIAITFDDGPNEVFTPKVLELLKKYNAKATFFCIGKNIEANPEIFKQLVEVGHVVGNHSYSHSNNFGFFSKAQVKNELAKTNDLIYSFTNIKTNLFRPPFGVTNPNIKKVLSVTKHYTIGWNVRSLDTVIKNPTKIFNRIKKRLKAGDVILLHDTNDRSIIVLEQLLLFLQENQFETVTVDSLFDIDAYV